MDEIRYYLVNPVFTCGGIFMISILALVVALGTEFTLNLDPCELCIWQRWPYVITTALGMIGLVTLYREEWVQYASMVIFIAAAVFFANFLLAFYHVGVEYHWWTSALEGCAVEFKKGSLEELVAMFDDKIPARCDDVKFRFLGISMAGYNMLLSLALAVASGYSAVLVMRRDRGEI